MACPPDINITFASSRRLYSPGGLIEMVAGLLSKLLSCPSSLAAQVLGAPLEYISDSLWALAGARDESLCRVCTGFINKTTLRNSRI